MQGGLNGNSTLNSVNITIMVNGINYPPLTLKGLSLMPTRSFRTTDALDRQITALQLAGFGNVTQVVTIAIDRMFRDERGKAPAHKIEIWQHVGSGERYATLSEAGRFIAASGPLHHKEIDEIIAGETDIAWDEKLADDINAEEDQADEQAYRRVWPE
jgi:hypothetical protein